MSELVDTEIFEDVVDVGLKIVKSLAEHLHSSSSQHSIHSAIVVI